MHVDYDTYGVPGKAPFSFLLPRSLGCGLHHAPLASACIVPTTVTPTPLYEYFIQHFTYCNPDLRCIYSALLETCNNINNNFEIKSWLFGTLVLGNNARTQDTSTRFTPVDRTAYAYRAFEI
jgi:hypothetical protein